MDDRKDLSGLERRLLYKFKEREFIEEACRHSSFVNERSAAGMYDNERFEFLGDAVLNLVVGHILMIRFPEVKEGDLSKMRASLVNEGQLATIARNIDLGPYIMLGRGEAQTGGHEKKSILANTFEAVVAAVYLDGGYNAAYGIIEAHFSALINSISRPDAGLDYKSKLQELVQTDQKETPVYRIIRENGPDHDKTFRVSLETRGVQTLGVGKSKKTAEQNAAKQALEILETKEEQPG
jgi:ribonuclease-3